MSAPDASPSDLGAQDFGVVDHGVVDHGVADHGVGVGARRLAVMLRHSTHLFFGLLWLVAMIASVRDTSHRTPTLALGALEGVLYGGGLVFAGRASGPRIPRGNTRRQLVGRAWLAALVLVWMLLVGLTGHWWWLAFPLYFLVFFIAPGRWRWAVVAVMAGWAAASGLLHHEHLDAQQVLGSVLSAMVAVISWIVLEQLRANVREQQRLVEQVRATQQQLLAATEQQARDHERERLSRDLHDTLAQGLNSIVMLSRATSARHPDLATELGVIETTARENLAHARAMMRGVPPVTPAPTPAPVESTEPHLFDEVRRVVDAAQAREQVIGSGLKLGCAEEGAPRPLDAARRHALVMGVRSLVANVVQHAHAQRCQVTITWQDDHLALDVVDDGVGFVPGAAPGYGLAALRSRLHEFGATMELVSEPGQGCSVAITVPLPNQAHAASDQEVP